MLQDSELARRNGGRIETRAGGIRVRWELDDLATSDGHTAQAVFSCTIRALTNPTEQKMLDEALLGARPVVTVTDLANHFSPALQSAARRATRGVDADSLLAEIGRRNLIDRIAESANAVAFSSGVEILPPLQLDLDCPTLRQQKAAQRRVAEQADQLRRSAELFAQFEKIRASAPALSPGQILQRIGVADQAELLRGLLQNSAVNGSCSQLWAVAGPSLIQISFDNSPSAKTIALPDLLGPTRSVQPAANGKLWIGCRGGVMRIDPNNPCDFQVFFDSKVASQLGFNAVVETSGRVWATHGEAGIVGWDLDNTREPAVAIRPELPNSAPRNLIAWVDNRLLYSAGRQLFHFDGSKPQALATSASAEVAGIFPQRDGIIAIHEDGTVGVLSGRNWQEKSESRRAGRLVAAGALPWLGDVRILLATEDGPVICISPDDELTTQYASAYRGLRILAADQSIVAAVTPDRQRLLLWHTWDGRQPFADIHLFTQTRHRISDIAFG